MIVAISTFPPLVFPAVTVDYSATSTPRGLSHNLFFRDGLIWYFYKNGSDLVYEFSSDGETFTTATNSPAVDDLYNSNEHFDVYFDSTDDTCYVAYRQTSDRLYVIRGSWNAVDADWDWGTAYNCYNYWWNWFYPAVVTCHVTNRTIIGASRDAGPGSLCVYNTRSLDLATPYNYDRQYSGQTPGGKGPTTYLKMDNGSIFSAITTYSSGPQYKILVNKWQTDGNEFGTSPIQSQVYVNAANTDWQKVLSWNEVDGVPHFAYQDAAGNLNHDYMTGQDSWSGATVVVATLTVGLVSVSVSGTSASYLRYVWTENDEIRYKVYTDSWGVSTLWLSETGLDERFLCDWNPSGVSPYLLVGWSRSSDNRFDLLGSPPFDVPINVSIEITNMDAENWVFQGEKYYYFNATWTHGTNVSSLDLLSIRFSDEVNELVFSYNYTLHNSNSSNPWGTDHTLNDFAYNPAVLSYELSNAYLSGNYVVVTFCLMVNHYIIDALDVDLEMRGQDVNDNDTGWQTIEPEYFNIYNVGGKAQISSSGSAGRLENGDLFDVYADEDSWVLVNQSFRNMKFVDAIFALDLVGNSTVDEGEDYSVNVRNLGYYYFGMDFCVNDTWVQGWHCRLEATWSDFGWRVAPGPNTVDSYIIFIVYWYYQGVNVGSYSFTSGYFEGKSVNPPGDDNPNNIQRMHLRLWFNKINGSSAVGGWMAPVYYGPTPTGSWWWTGSWAPLKVLPNSMSPTIGTAINTFFFHDLEDENGTIRHYDELTMQRFWAKIERNSDEIDYRHQIAFTQKLDFVINNEPGGVDTPEPLEPMLPDLPQYGIFSWIASQLNWLGKAIVNALGPGLLDFWSIFVGFLDTIFTRLGWENGFSQILLMIGEAVSWIPTSLELVWSFGVSAFLFITGAFVAIMTQFVAFISFLGEMWGMFVWIWDELYPYWGWVPTVLVQLTPLIMFFFVLWLFLPLIDKGNYEGTMNRINLTVGYVVKIVEYLGRGVDFAINLIYRLAEMIPVVE